MADAAKIDRMISDFNNLEEEDKIVFFNRIEKMFDDIDVAQDENVSIESAFGLWKDRNISVEAIREKAWISRCVK